MDGGSVQQSVSPARLVSSAPGQGEAVPLLIEEALVEARQTAHKSGQNGWLGTAFVIVGSTLGTGVLAMPSAFGTLGWVCGIIACGLCGIASTYSGMLLSWTRQELTKRNVPCNSFSDAAAAIGKPWQAKLTTGLIMINWVLLLPYYLMASANSIVQGFGFRLRTDLCYYEWALVVMALLLVPLQQRNFHELHLWAMLSDLSAVVFLVIVLFSLGLQHDHTDKVPTSALPPSGETLINAYGALSTIVFSFQSQSLFLEAMKEMKAPEQFGTRTVPLSNFFLTLVYVATAATAYGMRGARVASFLPAAMHDNWLKTIVGVLLLYHIIIAYAITHQPLADRTQNWFFKRDASAPKSTASRLHWAAIGVGYLIFSYGVANAIPFFADFQGIIGAALGAPIVFFFPAWFFLGAMKQAKKKVHTAHRVVCIVYMVVITPLFIVLGLWSSIKSLREDWSLFGLPFSCHLVGYS
eukprot:m.487057 g.487057  ORF g.487057 m.487057 type:complete len:467 (+) comp24762_c0_seq1:315-1715(+)